MEPLAEGGAPSTRIGVLLVGHCRPVHEKLAEVRPVIVGPGREVPGVRAGRLLPLGRILTTPGFTDEVIHLFAAFDLAPSQMRHESDEVIEVLRVSLAEALDCVWSGELVDAKSALALLHAARHVGRLR